MPRNGLSESSAALATLAQLPDSQLSSTGAAELGNVANDGGSAGADIEERRRYNREFMRRWRSDPFHSAMERKKRRD